MRIIANIFSEKIETFVNLCLFQIVSKAFKNMKKHSVSWKNALLPLSISCYISSIPAFSNVSLLFSSLVVIVACDDLLLKTSHNELELS